MDVTELIPTLDYVTSRYPREAVQFAMEHRDEATPVLLACLEQTALEVSDEEPDTWGFVMAAIILGWMRETQAHPHLLALISLPGEMPHTLFGDTLTEDVAQLLWETSGGEIQSLNGLSRNRNLNPYVRCNGAEAMMFGVAEGRLEREQLMALLVEYLTEEEDPERPFTEDDRLFFSSCAHNLCELYPASYRDVLDEAYAQGRIELDYIAPEDVAMELSKPEAEVLAGFRQRHLTRLQRDPHERMSWWASFNPQSGGWSEPLTPELLAYMRNQRKAKRKAVKKRRNKRGRKKRSRNKR